jgi:membrane-anchored protein YejM (alkaline phosphatase superfamily)
MRAAGYATAAFINQPGLYASRGFASGFDSLQHPERGGVAEHVQKPGADPTLLQWSALLSNSYANDRALIRAMDRWLEEHAGENVFVWLHLLTPHQPHNPPRKFREAIDPGAGEVERLSLLYDQEVRATDALFGEAMAVLDRHSDPEERLVVLTSDHGEEFGEHGSQEHGHSLHREVIRVPLVLAGAGLPQGARVGARVRSVDVMPTLLELSDIALEDQPGLAGRSLLPVVRGEEGARNSWSEAMLYGTTKRTLVTRRFRLIFEDRGALRVFDLDADPDEMRDLAGIQRKRTQDLVAEVELMHAELLRRHAEHVADESTGEPDPEELEKIERALRELGYVE